MQFLSKERIGLGLDHRLLQAIAITFVVYFLWMDVALYQTVQSTQPLRIPGKNMTVVSTTPVPNAFSPFSGLSIKMMMTDQMCHYVETPIAKIINAIAHLSSCFWISPNMISFVGTFFALGACWCISFDHRGLHVIAVSLMFCRGLMDALDGIVARERVGEPQFLSLRNTPGYIVDGVADTIGYTLFLVGCLIYLRRNVSKQKHYMQLSVSSGGKALENQSNLMVRKITIAIVCFGFQIALSCFFWDRYCDKYHKLLETSKHFYSQAIVQNEVLKSNLMWVTAWSWRILNSHALMNFFLGSVLINKMSPFLHSVQYLGYIALITLIIFTEIHLHDVRTYIEGVKF